MSRTDQVDFEAMKSFILNKLQMELSENLFYHSIHHTEDVFNTTLLFIKHHGIDEESALLLKTAALYHDSGFTVNAKEHEQIGCEIARNSLTGFGYTDNQIKIICSMIMATKIPQSPKTKLEELICDADLDYLGREDYSTISHHLFNEIKINQEINHEKWLQLQIQFLKQHHFFSDYSIELRNEKKSQHMQSIMKELETLKK